MERLNLFSLKNGENKIVITQEDIGCISGKFPIIKIPESYYVINMYIDVIQPFVGSGNTLNTNTQYPLQYNFKVGNSQIDDYYLTLCKANSLGLKSVNNGNYFTYTSMKYYPQNIYLTSHIIPRIWIIGNDLAVARYYGYSCGIKTAGLIFGGTPDKDSTEEFNGSVWSSGGDMNAGKYGLAGCGTQTSALSFGGTTSGEPLDTLETYNGTVWSTSQHLLNTARAYLCGLGTSNDALSFGGLATSSVPVATTEAYDGSAWTTINSLNYERYHSSGAGTTSAAFVVGGHNLNNTLDSTELFDGLVWAIGEDCNIKRWGTSSAGTQHFAVCCGGAYYSSYSHVEEFNGSTWTVGNNMNLERRHGSTFGGNIPGVSVGGRDVKLNTLGSTEIYTNVDPSNLFISGKMSLNVTGYK